MVTEVIRPAAVVPEETAREILIGAVAEQRARRRRLVRRAQPVERYDQPLTELDNPGSAGLIGTIQVAYGTPRKYDITILPGLGDHPGTRLAGRSRV